MKHAAYAAEVVFAGHGVYSALQALCPGLEARRTNWGEPILLTYAVARFVLDDRAPDEQTMAIQLVEAMAEKLIDAHRKWRRHKWGPFRWGMAKRLVVRQAFSLNWSGDGKELCLTCRVGFE